MLTIEQEATERINQLVDDLRAARDIIARDGLVKYHFGMKSGAPSCTMGALMRSIGFTCPTFNYSYSHYDAQWQAIYNHPRFASAAYALSCTLGKEGRNAIYDFNDHPETTAEDVIGLFDTTINNLT